MSGQFISLSSYCSKVFRNFYTLEIDLGVKHQRLNSIANTCLSYSQYFSGKTTLRYENGRFHIMSEGSENSPLVQTANKSSFVYRKISHFLYGVVAVFATPIGTLARLVNCLYSHEVRAAIFSEHQKSAEPKFAAPLQPDEKSESRTPVSDKPPADPVPPMSPVTSPLPPNPSAAISSATATASTLNPADINFLALIQQVASGLVDPTKSAETWVLQFDGQLEILLKHAIAFFDKLMTFKSDREKALWLQTQTEYPYPFFFSLVLLSKNLENSLNPTLLKRLKIQHKLSLTYLEKLRLTPLLKKVPQDTPANVIALVHSQEEYLSTQDACLREVLLKTPVIKLYFQLAPIFAKYKKQIVPAIQKFWENELTSIKKLNHYKQRDINRKNQAIIDWVLKESQTPTLFGTHFSSDLNTIFELHAPFLDEKFVQGYREAYQICAERMKTLFPPPEASTKSEKQTSVESAENLPNINTSLLEEIIGYFQEFIRLPDDQCEKWLAEKAQQPDYFYPFSQSENILRDAGFLKKALKAELINKWEQLYLEAQQKLIRLGLIQYLDEANPQLVAGFEKGLSQIIQMIQLLPPASQS